MQETLIRINPTHIQIETTKNGKKSVKNTDLRSVQEVLTRGERIETPLLPGQWGCQKYIKTNDRELYVITTPPHIREVTYDYRNEGNDPKKFKVPLPAMLFIFIININPQNGARTYNHGMAYAIKNPLLTDRDQMYYFPFSNVDGRWMCWGDGDSYPTIGAPKSITTIPDQFLNNPFNNHLDGDKFDSFRGTIRGRDTILNRTSHLFDHLHTEQEKAEKEGSDASFPLACLKRQHSFSDALEYFVRNYLR